MKDQTASEDKGGVLKIDVGAVLRQRLPRYSRFIPRFLVRGLEKLICQDGLNSLLESSAGREGASFCRGVLEDLDADYTIYGSENMPDPSDRKVIYVCNHPLGALDGIALIDMITRHHGVEPHFVVNDLLWAVKPLRTVFVPINKHGGQSRVATDRLHEAFAADAPVIVFPAGLVSRKNNEGKIRDLEWQKMFVNKAVEYGRDIFPVYFGGRNSSFFYNFAKLRTRTGMKFNVEMVLLPREVFRCRHSRFPIAVGKRQLSADFTGGRQARSEARKLREMIYSDVARLIPAD